MRRIEPTIFALFPFNPRLRIELIFSAFLALPTSLAKVVVYEKSEES